MRIICPNCQASGQIDDKWNGKTINCPKCQQKFTAEEQPVAPEPVTPPTHDDETPPTPESVEPAEPQDVANCSQCDASHPQDNLMNFDGVLVCSICKKSYLQRMREGVVTSGPGEGGNIEDALAGNYDFAVMDVIKEAWSKTNGTKGSVWGALGIIYALIFAMMIIIIPVTMMGNEAAAGIVSFVVQIAYNVVTLPMMAGIMMIGIRRSVNQPFSYKFSIRFFKLMWPLFLLYLVMYLMLMLGFLLLIIPGIYLLIAYGLAIPLLVEKGLTPWQALETSRKSLGHKWFKIFGLYLMVSLILFISAIPLGIGLIWTIPMAVISLGILYRTVFGVGPATEQI
jgi:predicted Zn finger-like uncharacterized protein